LEESNVATIDVQFKNPFYHNTFGLLGGADEDDTVYTLPYDTPLPRSAIVLEGVSLWRKENPSEARVGRPRVADLEQEDRADSAPPRRRTPVEGSDKKAPGAVRKRKAKAA
jgi:hypothetical protein